MVRVKPAIAPAGAQVGDGGTRVAGEMQDAEARIGKSAAQEGVAIGIARRLQHDRSAGEIGDLLVQGDSTMAFYWNKHETTKRTLQGDWIRTGDKYWRDTEGFYWHAAKAVPNKDGAAVHAFTCTNDTWYPEADAMAKIVNWVKAHPAIRVHVSVRCNAQDAPVDNVFGSPVGLTAGSHMANISDVVAPLQLNKQLIGSASCDVGSLMGGGKGLPGPSGVYIEIVSGCPEGAAHANQLICQ